MTSSIDKRTEVTPEWEPTPWDARYPEVDEQASGFRRRALKPLVWRKIDWQNFPSEGIFGYDRAWFSSNEIVCVATFDGEDLILDRAFWHGWPDPPEWGLASRPAGEVGSAWRLWGCFANLPSTWTVPDLG